MKASGHERSAITTTVDQMPEPMMEASTSRKMTGGSVMARSTDRMAIASAQRPPRAEIAPIRSRWLRKAPRMKRRRGRRCARPSIVRANTSRPTPSVPNQCFQLGRSSSAIGRYRSACRAAIADRSAPRMEEASAGQGRISRRGSVKAVRGTGHRPCGSGNGLAHLT